MNDLIESIIEREGGYVIHPADKGGPTKYGITRRTLSDYRGHFVSVSEVENLTLEEARLIYRDRYVVAPGFDKIPESTLKNQLVDFGVHSGPATAILNLQEVLGVAADGKLGPATLEALSKSDLPAVNTALFKRRLLLIARIVKRDPTQSAFILGWVNRILEFI